MFVVSKSFFNEYAKNHTMEKALSHKYVKRVPKKSGKGYDYYYSDGHGGLVKGKEDEKKPTKTAEPEVKNTRSVGETIEFNQNGHTLTGRVVAVGTSGVTVEGKGEAQGVRYQVRNENIGNVKENADGTIPGKSFNAADYKSKFTDKNATNDQQGYDYIYKSLGDTGREAAAVTVKRLEEQTKRMRKGDTQTRNTINGEYTPERKELHKAIIASILSPEKIAACTPKNGEKPKFIMFGGRGGSGKSWFTDKDRAKGENREVMFDSDNYMILDADAIKEYLPEYEGWNAGEVHEESSYLNKEIKRQALEKGLNIIIDGTMNYNPSKPDKVKNEMLEAKSKGYSLEAHYMFVPVQESAKRAINRFKSRNGDFSGRLVPMNVLMSMQDNEKSFDSVKDIVDDWSFRDNQGKQPKLISKK